jgi:hypothetical protein
MDWQYSIVVGSERLLWIQNAIAASSLVGVAEARGLQKVRPRGFRGTESGDGMAYCTNVGPRSGPLRLAAGYCAVSVFLERVTRTPIGEALAVGEDEDGLALWRLTVGEIELPGLFVAIDREFRPVGGDGRPGTATAEIAGDRDTPA